MRAWPLETEMSLSEKVDLNSGENLTDSKAGIMSFAVSKAVVFEWFGRQRQNIKPWSDFANTKKFSTPKSLAPVSRRLIQNVERFQANYMCIFLGLLALCILTSPVLLVVMALCGGACYYVSIRNVSNKIILLGRELTLASQYACVGVLAFFLFWGAGAGSAVFSVLGFSVLIVVLHAALYNVEDDVAELFESSVENV